MLTAVAAEIAALIVSAANTRPPLTGTKRMSSACKVTSGTFASKHFLQLDSGLRHARRSFASDARAAHLCRVIRAPGQSQCLQHGERAVIHQKPAGTAHVAHHVDNRRSGHVNGVAGQYVHVAGQVVGKVAGKIDPDGLRLPTPNDGDLARGQRREASRL